MTEQAPLSARFVHLHLHSEYSLLDGGNTVSRLIKRCQTHGMDAIAVTDHGNLHVAVELFTKAKAAGIKPILGIEAYVAPESRELKKATGVADGGFHLVLLAENNTGWRNLLKLSSDSFLTGFYRKPRMDKETLTQWSDGLIAINGHLGSSIAWHLTRYVQTRNEAHFQAACDEARWHADTFGTNEEGEPRFYLELQRHDVDLQMQINPHIERMAAELGLPLVCDNDSHFLTRNDWDTHDTLCCISMGKLKTDPNRLHYSRDLYVKTPEEMEQLFHDRLDAVENTVKIANRCNVELDFDANHAPVVKIVSRYEHLPTDSEGALALIDAFECAHPVGSTEWFKEFCEQFSLEPFNADEDTETPDELKEMCDGALRVLSEAGAIWRYGRDGVNEDKRARMDRELGILADKLISAYFLICWDCVNWARQNGIPANARGSGVGTMVGFVLGLSNACPVEYGLLFERFTDPDRSEYPDIDIDICQDGRGDCIDYVRRKYGHVAQIITFGRLKARAAIKDVARVNGLAATEGQRLSNLVPDELNIKIKDALEKDPEFKGEYERNPDAKRVIDTAMALEDHARHTGIHAAGVIVATQPLDNIIPLCKPSNKDAQDGVTQALTQWDGPTCERMGLLKLDFLGLRTLSTIERARTLIRETLPEEAIWAAVGKDVPSPDSPEPHPLELERLAYDDQKVLELFRRGDTAGIFQFESGGMRKLLTEMRPDRLEDLIAANALYRPGPMDLIPDYCARKHGQAPVPEVHEIVDSFTAETYGIMVYQEQVMQIVHGLGDIPLRSAYTLIKAISKKKHDVINANRPKFIEGAGQKGLDAKKANELFDLILKFAGYGFNKSHSTGYAIVAYQTAYLKTYFPNQYMAALLTYESAARKVDDWVPYLQDCRNTQYADHTPERPHVGVDVHPPSINLSQSDFSVVFKPDEVRSAFAGHVRFGLSAIRGVGKSAIAAVIEERQKNGAFASIFDFCERVSTRSVSRSAIEALIGAGAFDEVHSAEERSAMIAALDGAIAAGQSLAEDRMAGQMNIFATMEEESSEVGGGDSESAQRPLPSVPPWSQLTALAREKEVLGFHVSGHPMDQHRQIVDTFCSANTRRIAEMADGAPVILAGMLARVRNVLTRKDSKPMAMITVEDAAGTVDGVAFPRTFAACGDKLILNSFVVLIGKTDQTRNEPQVIVEKVIPIEEAPAHLCRDLIVDIVDRNGSTGDGLSPTAQMQMVRGLLGQARGAGAGDGKAATLHVNVRTGGRRVTLKSRSLRVVATPSLLHSLRDVVGGECVHMTALGAEEHIEKRKVWVKRGGGEEE